MKPLNSITQDLRKIFTSYGFWACAGITAALCFTAGIYRDFTTNQEYTIFGIWTSFDREWLLQNISFSSINVFKAGGGSWLSMFIPIVSAFPFVPLFCDERHSGQMRYSIFRSGKFRYNISKLISALIGGGCATALGYIVFGIFISAMFPPLSSYPTEQIANYITYNIKTDYYAFSALYDTLGNFTVIFSSVLEMFLYGALSAMPAFILSSFIRNKYLIMCFPFMFKYIYDQSMQKLQIESFINSDEHLKWFTEVFYSNSLNNLFTMEDKILPILIINLCVIVLSLIIFNVFMNRRSDLGA